MSRVSYYPDCPCCGSASAASVGQASGLFVNDGSTSYALSYQSGTGGTTLAFRASVPDPNAAFTLEAVSALLSYYGTPVADFSGFTITA